jgi:hypothetical protein
MISRVVEVVYEFVEEEGGVKSDKILSPQSANPDVVMEIPKSELMERGSGG